MDVEWYGDPKFVQSGSVRAPLPSVQGWPAKTLSVQELIDLLEKEDPYAPVGTALSNVAGHVTGFVRLTHDEFGAVILDQDECQLYSDEVRINSYKEEAEVKRKWVEKARLDGCLEEDMDGAFIDARRNGGKGTT